MAGKRYSLLNRVRRADRIGTATIVHRDEVRALREVLEADDERKNPRPLTWRKKKRCD